MDLAGIRKNITSEFLKGFSYEPVEKDKYSDFSYPKVIKLMKFNTERYQIKGFGSLMSMHTTTKMGMELLTVSFTPGEGVTVPYLLIDIMTLGKKRTVFVEYYDRTKNKADSVFAEEVFLKFNTLPEYEEKPKWYVSERTPYSLIKCGDSDSDEKLTGMINKSVKAYSKMIKAADCDKENIPELIKFRDRMINEGNPSSSVLTKVFGKVGAADFFKTCVMPVMEGNL